MVSIKVVTNADTGTADIVGGDDWDAIAGWVNATYKDVDTASAPADPATTVIRTYAKVIDSNNNAQAAKQKIGGAMVEVVDF